MAVRSLGTTVSAHIGADALPEELLQASVTLGNAGVITVITLPNWVRGFRLKPAENDVLFAVGEDPEALTAASGAALDEDDFGVGNVAVADEVEVRLLAADDARTLRLRSATNATVVTVELFG